MAHRNLNITHIKLNNMNKKNKILRENNFWRHDEEFEGFSNIEIYRERERVRERDTHTKVFIKLCLCPRAFFRQYERANMM
jgi:hypothetical protein